MEFTGRCYCGDIQYSASGDPAIKLQCHCRECQYFASGSPNIVLGLPEAGFAYTKGSAKPFSRSDLDARTTVEPARTAFVIEGSEVADHHGMLGGRRAHDEAAVTGVRNAFDAGERPVGQLKQLAGLQ